MKPETAKRLLRLLLAVLLIIVIGIYLYYQMPGGRPWWSWVIYAAASLAVLDQARRR